MTSGGLGFFRRETPGAWAALSGLSALFFLVTAGTFSSLGVVLPEMVRTLHWDWTGAGLGFTLLGLATGLASYAPTVVTRTVGVRPTLLLGAAVTAAGFFCFFAARSLALYWLGAALAGTGFALCAIIPGTYILARAFTRPSAAFGLYFTIGGLGGVAGPWLYLLAQRLTGGWRGYWLSLAVAAIVLGVIAAILAEPGAASDSAGPAPTTGGRRPIYRTDHAWGVREALGTPQFWIIVAAYTTYLLCEVTVNGLSVQHLTDRGASFTLAGALLSFQALVSVFARGAAGAVGERVEPRTLVIASMGLLAVGLAALALAHGLVLMSVYAICVGAGYGGAYLATTVLLLNYFGRERNLELFSLMCLVSTLASAGPVVGGLVHDRLGGFAPALWGFAAVAGLAMIAVLAMRPPAAPAKG